MTFKVSKNRGYDFMNRGKVICIGVLALCLFVGCVAVFINGLSEIAEQVDNNGGLSAAFDRAWNGKKQ